MRTSEVLSLTIRDVDLPGAVLTIRDSKFFKTRLVPIGPKTAQVLAEYASRRKTSSRYPVTPFFVVELRRTARLVSAASPANHVLCHGSEEMIRRYTHLRPDFMRDELARVPDFTPKNASKIVEIAPVAPQLAVAV